MRVRLIAVENLLLALPSDADSELRKRIKSRAAEIQPREGAADHPLTERTAAEMLKLMDRATR